MIGESTYCNTFFVLSQGIWIKICRKREKMTEKRNNCFYHHRNTYHTYKRKIRFMAIQSDTIRISIAARAVLFKDGIKNLLRFFTVLCIPAFSSCPHGFQNRFQTFPKSVKRYSTRGGDFCIHMAIDTVDDEKTSARPFAAA